MSISIIESNLENAIIDHLKELGYFYFSPKKILEKRKNYSEVILFDELKIVIKRINPHLSEENLKKVIFKLRQVQQASLEVANKDAHDYLINGVKIENRESQMTESVQVVDFDKLNNNNFLLTRQLIVRSDHPEYNFQRPDLVLYLNGLPVVVFELKSPDSDDDQIIHKAFQQMKNYQKFLKNLFVFNIFNVISNKHVNKYGSITASFGRYNLWKSPEKKINSATSSLKIFLQLLFKKKTFLNLLKNYIFFTNQDPSQKIIASYHQFYGVERSRKAILEGINASTSQKKRAGIFWHTQGSGKSFSMIMLVKNVVTRQQKLTTLIITDRNSLDEQISVTFQQAGEYVSQGQKVKQINSIEELKKELKDRRQNGIFFSTVQKFADQVGLLSERNDILIIADEAHRSHQNIQEGTLKIVDEKQLVVEKFSYASNLHKAFPQATFIGFTATPIEKKDKATKKVFGQYLTKYLLNDATKDGFVVNIKYESRLKSLLLDPKYIKLLDEKHEINLKKIWKKTESKEMIKKYNKGVQQIEKIIGDDDRLDEIAKDFINHYQMRRNILKGKAIFVALNRKIAFKYYHKIIKFAPELKEKIKIIMTANKQYDNEAELKLIGSKETRKRAAKEFKKPDSNFKIAIVVEMWLTGFDVPSLDVIYIDRYIKMHNLMQAICRVNRVYTDNKQSQLIKKNGLVVDYIGLFGKIKEAYKFYNDGEKIISYWENSKVDKNELLQEMKIIYENFFSTLPTIDHKKITNHFGNYLYYLVEKMQELIIKNKKKQAFLDASKKLQQLINVVLTILTKEEKEKIQILILVRGQLIKREMGKFDLDQQIKEMQELLGEAIKYNKTIIYDQYNYQPISLQKILTYILQKEKKILENPYLQLEKKICALKLAINDYQKINSVRGEKLSKKIKLLLEKYENNFLTEKDLEEGLKKISKTILESKKNDTNLGMDKGELAFYEIIGDNQYSKDSYDGKMIKKITQKVFLQVKNKIDHTWIYNEVMKQEVRATIKITLTDYHYPPQDREKLQKKLVLQLTNYMEEEPKLFIKPKKS